MPLKAKAPVWQEDQSFEDYIKEIKVWQLLKSCEAKEEGPLLFRALTGKAKEAANELTVAQIGSETGLELILGKLDKFYLGDKNQRIYNELDAFENFKRPASMTMPIFLVEFERLHTKVRSHDCNYPDGVLAYKVLQAAQLSSEHQKLCKATIETGKWSYQAVVDQIKKIFGDISSFKSHIPDRPIKLEPVMFTNTENDCCGDYLATEDDSFTDDDQYRNFNNSAEEHDIYYGNYAGRNNYYRNNNRNNYRNTLRGNPSNRPVNNPSYKGNGQQNQGRRYINVNINKLKDSYSSDPNTPNPKDDRGFPTTCRRCRSIYHWVQDCPHATNQEAKNPSVKSKVYHGSDLTDEIYISLFQTSTPATVDEVRCLVAETMKMAVIDSGCPTNVCGRKWFTEYAESLSEIERSNLQTETSRAMFRFGDSEPMTSMKKVLLPITLTDKKMYLPTDVVDADVPLLLSKETLKNGKAVTDFENETIEIYNTKQPMLCTSSGHYAIPIIPHNTAITPNIIMKINKIINEDSNVKSMAKKLHQQYGHPSARRLIDLVKKAGEGNEALIKEIEEVGKNCDSCKRYQKTRPRPAVTFPLASIFNETVAMDLKVYKNNAVYFLHVIDHATRFSAAGVIRSKKAETIIRKFLEIWISIFGCPQTVLSDNGGEFANHEFMDLCRNMNINFLTTAAEAPYSNGICEKHNGLIGDAVYKIMDDINCSVEIALCWAVNAKNSLQNIHGFSPYQLVFGRNPNLPAVINDKLPALEGVTGSKLVADILNALHKAREETIKHEASEKLRRALKSKVRTHNDIRYFQGEEVFYKEEDVKRWAGPGRVIGQDGSKILIKIPTGLITVHSSRVTLTSQAEQDRRIADKNEAEQQRTITEEVEDDIPHKLSNSKFHPSDVISCSLNDAKEDSQDEYLNINEVAEEVQSNISQTVEAVLPVNRPLVLNENESDSQDSEELFNSSLDIASQTSDDNSTPIPDHKPPSTPDHRPPSTPDVGPSSTIPDNIPPPRRPEERPPSLRLNDTPPTQTITDSNLLIPDIRLHTTDIPNSPSNDELIHSANSSQTPINSTETVPKAQSKKKTQIPTMCNLPKRHQCVEFKPVNSENWKRCRILSKCKSTGKHRNWVNIQNIDDRTEESIDWENMVQEWNVLNNNVFLATGKDHGYEVAKETELENWKKMGVYEVVEDDGQSYITVRWVNTEKIVNGNKVKKSRLVARGYEEILDGVATDSPTINKESLRIAYMITAGKNWEINSLDVRAAFLQGRKINREVYLKPPKEANMKGKLWKLRQCVYGLNYASREFYMKVKEELMKVGCECSHLDQAVFTYHEGDKLEGIIMSHVDDFFWAGTERFMSTVIDKIRNTFKISSENSILFTYLGLMIQQCDDGIYISQNKYAKEIEEIEINPTRAKELQQPITEEEKSSLRSVIGQLNWLSMQTRPDLAYDVCELSTSLKDGTVSLLKQANKVIKKAKFFDVCLFFPKMDLTDLSITAFADASHGNLTDGGSQGGMFIEVRSGGYTCPVEWQSKRIRRAAKSTLAAETIALVEAIDNAIYVKHMIQEILHVTSNQISIDCITDNYSLYQTAHSTTSVGDRRLRIELAIVREAIEKRGNNADVGKCKRSISRLLY